MELQRPLTISLLKKFRNKLGKRKTIYTFILKIFTLYYWASIFVALLPSMLDGPY